jgi:hypothetical protein
MVGIKGEEGVAGRCLWGRGRRGNEVGVCVFIGWAKARSWSACIARRSDSGVGTIGWCLERSNLSTLPDCSIAT